MAKLKTAILRAQETADITGANENLLWEARDVLSLAIMERVDAKSCARNAKQALFLINTYLMESELCKR
jgi:hypothetical protein